ncbi:hypothetical protein PSAB6_250057 [Paraburkholderia sabiae]|nr:hypothetical protein PSAB6_250057 [Paraburkholderia sabiae]
MAALLESHIATVVRVPVIHAPLRVMERSGIGVRFRHRVVVRRQQHRDFARQTLVRGCSARFERGKILALLWRDVGARQTVGRRRGASRQQYGKRQAGKNDLHHGLRS